MIAPCKVIRGDSKRPAVLGLVWIFVCAVLGARECQPPTRAGCGVARSQVEASWQWWCQTCAVPSHETNPCPGPAQHVAVGLVLPPAEMLLLRSLYSSSGATCALRLGTQTWAQLLCGALHPPIPLTTSAWRPGAGGTGQPNPHMAGASESTLPVPGSLRSGCISHPSCRAAV